MFWLPLALIGFPPWAILLAQSWNLIYQFLLHTEAVDRLPRPVELVLNTPSHHRVHHGVQEQYLDRNYAGIFILWDRLFGTFEPEGERVRYGLTTNIETHHPVKVAYHEWYALTCDVRRASGWRDRLSYLLRGPGWAPAGVELPVSAAAATGGPVGPASSSPGSATSAGASPQGAAPAR